MAHAAATTQPSERRRAPRFEVPGAELASFDPSGGRVSVSKPGLSGWLSPRFWRVHELRDLSCGGLRLEADLPIEVGQRLALSLHLRQWCAPMRLLGTVRWVQPTASGQCMAGVELAAFDDSDDANPIAAREAIARLQARHCAQ